SALFVVPGPLVATQLALPAPLGVALGLAFLLRLVVVRVPAEPAERVHEQGQREQPGDDQGGAGAPAADEPPLRVEQPPPRRRWGPRQGADGWPVAEDTG